uniref:Uncharacterized protein n=1 Tax=Magallana gigas TaxID=29159 RepID=K1Q3W0_MAGGI
MRFSRSKTECPPLERLAIPSKEDLRSKGLHCDAKRAVIMTFLGGRRQFASRTDFDWSYNDLCRQFKMFTEVDEFVEAVNITIGNLDIVLETQIDSQATVYADDFGFLEPVCSETCDPEADGSESHSFEPPLKKQKVKPLQASLSKSQALTNNFQDDILKSIRGKTLTVMLKGVFQGKGSASLWRGN